MFGGVPLGTILEASFIFPPKEAQNIKNEKNA